MVTPGQLDRRAQLYEQLAASIAAGLPLIQSLQLASRNGALRGSRKTILALLHQLNEGHTFADSMKKTSGWLPEFDIALLSVGEESGRLDVAFRQLSRYYTSRARIIRETIKSCMVPIATLHVAMLIIPLSLLTGLALGIRDGDYAKCLLFFAEKILTFGSLYGTIYAISYVLAGKRSESMRATVEDILGIVPLLGTARKYLAISRLAAALDALTSAGVTTVRAWEMSAEASGSPHLKRKIFHWAPQLETGITPAEMVNSIRYFPEMFTNLYQTAELSGKHDETLQRLHIYFEEEGIRTLQWFVRVASIVFYATIAVIVGIFVISFWVNYYGHLMSSD